MWLRQTGRILCSDTACSVLVGNETKSSSLCRGQSSKPIPGIETACDYKLFQCPWQAYIHTSCYQKASQPSFLGLLTKLSKYLPMLLLCSLFSSNTEAQSAPIIQASAIDNLGQYQLIKGPLFVITYFCFCLVGSMPSAFVSGTPCSPELLFSIVPLKCYSTDCAALEKAISSSSVQASAYSEQH